MVSNISIKKLTLNNFRNHKYLKLDISKNMILIYGQNGSGKTSVLESISLFDSSNGFRASTLSEIINNDFKGPIEMFGVNLILSESNDFTKIGIGLKKNTNKYQKIISVEGKKIEKILLTIYRIFIQSFRK